MQGNSMEYRLALGRKLSSVARRGNIVSPNDADGFFDFDPHQVKGLRKLGEAFGGGEKRGSIVHAGGLGKTVLEASIARVSQDVKAALGGPICETQDIILGTERTIIANIRDHLERLDVDFGQWSMGKRVTDRPVLLTSVQALQYNQERLQAFLYPDKVSLLVGDEMDLLVTGARTELLKKFRRAARIGLTATPERHDGRNAEDEWGDAVDRLGLSKALLQGLATPPVYNLFMADFDVSTVEIRNGDFYPPSLSAAMKAIEIEKAIPEVYEAMVPEKYRVAGRFPTLVFVPALDILDDVTKLLCKRFEPSGSKILSWRDGISDRQLEQDMNTFESGGVDILVLCKMGGRGMNLTRACGEIDAFPTLSKPSAEQRMSRVLRKIWPDSIPGRQGFQKPYAAISQIIPRSNSFSPITLLHVLHAFNQYEAGERLLFAGTGPGNPELSQPIREEVQQIVQRLRALRGGKFRLTLVDRVDVLRDLELHDGYIIKLDGNGMGEYRGKQVVGRCSTAAQYYGMSLPTFHKKLGGLTPIPYVISRTRSSTIPLYFKDDVGEVLQLVELGEDGMGKHKGRRVVGSCSAAAAAYGANSNSFRRELRENLIPLEGVTAKVGSQSVILYWKRDVDKVFPSVKVISLNDRGIGTYRGKEVVGKPSALTEEYQATVLTLMGKLAKLRPLKGVIAGSITDPVPLYSKADLDRIFPPVKILPLDENGMGEYEGRKVVGGCSAAAACYGVSITTFGKKMAQLVPVEGVMARSGGLRRIKLYLKTDVDELFPSVKLNDFGVGEHEGQQVVGRCSAAADHYGLKINTFSRRLSQLEPLSDVKGKSSGYKGVVLYSKRDVDALFS